MHCLNPVGYRFNLISECIHANGALWISLRRASCRLCRSRKERRTGKHVEKGRERERKRGGKNKTKRGKVKWMSKRKGEGESESTETTKQRER